MIKATLVTVLIALALPVGADATARCDESGEFFPCGTYRTAGEDFRSVSIPQDRTPAYGIVVPGEVGKWDRRVKGSGSCRYRYQHYGLRVRINVCAQDCELIRFKYRAVKEPVVFGVEWE